MLQDFLSSFILFSISSLSLINISSDSVGELVADDTTIRIFFPSVNIIPLDILIFSVDILSSGVNFNIHGLSADTKGVCSGKIVISPLSVGTVIFFINHSYITFSGLEIFSLILY
jgi:hypothetical protein